MIIKSVSSSKSRMDEARTHKVWRALGHQSFQEVMQFSAIFLRSEEYLRSVHELSMVGEEMKESSRSLQRVLQPHQERAQNLVTKNLNSQGCRAL
eukprot:2394168-Amphidinium_carterae.1